MANLSKTPWLRWFVIVAPVIIVILLAILIAVPDPSAPSPTATPEPPVTPTAVAVGSTAQPEPTAAPTVTPAPMPLPAVRMPFGVQVPDRLNDPAVVQRLVELGADWARVNLYWRNVEPQRTAPPTYNWQAMDRLLAALEPAGLNLILTVRDNPDWAADTLCGPLNPDGVAALADFLTAAVARYGQPPHNVAHWELYNEPDNGLPDEFPHYGGCWGHDGAAYAAMLQTAHAAIKRADPAAVVLLGGIAYEDFDTDIFVPDFLDTVLDAGGGTHFDVLNFHYYPAFADVWNRYGTDVAGKANYLRTELDRYGLTKPLMITEIGQPTDGPAEDAQPYSDARTATYVVQALVRSAAAELEAMIWFSLIDNPLDPRKYGLLLEDGTPKQAYRAYQTLTGRLGDAEFRRTLPAAELGGSGLEGYEFAVAGQPRWVVWAVDGQPHPLALTGSTVRVVSLLGEMLDVTDGSDGDADGAADGQVTVPVGPEPVYLEANAP